jgi:deoxyribonuclease-4
MFLGSQVSIRNGYFNAAQSALKIGAKGFQYFPKNPRNLSIKHFDKNDAKACAQFCKENALHSIAHAPYPTNISVEEGTLKELTINSLHNDLEIADACGSIGVVVHFGKYKGQDPLRGYHLMIDHLNEVLSNWNGKALLLIENNAGQGGKMGTTLEELVQIRQLTNFPEKIGFCLDTCHVFASGVWDGQNWNEVMKKGNELNYFKHLKAVHLNDSMFPNGSFRDRHANVGKGHIGEIALKEFLQSSFLEGIPIILETPTSSTYSHGDEIRYVSELLELN